MPDVRGAERSRYAGKRVLVVGTGHSAIGTLIDLALLAREAPGTEVAWAARGPDLTRAYGGGDADQLPERAALGQHLRSLVARGQIRLLAPFAIDAVDRHPGGAVTLHDADGHTAEADEVIVATGLRPDLDILREVRLDLDPALECPRALAPLIDPNVHSCGTVRPHGADELAQPDAGLFLAGMMSYGRAPTFLLATGYEQVRSIAACLAGDIAAARRIALDLPQTGMSSAGRSVTPGSAHAEAPASGLIAASGASPAAAAATSCCGTAGTALHPAPAEPAA